MAVPQKRSTPGLSGMRRLRPWYCLLVIPLSVSKAQSTDLAAHIRAQERRRSLARTGAITTAVAAATATLARGDGLPPESGVPESVFPAGAGAGAPSVAAPVCTTTCSRAAAFPSAEASGGASRSCDGADSVCGGRPAMPSRWKGTRAPEVCLRYGWPELATPAPLSCGSAACRGSGPSRWSCCRARLALSAASPAGEGVPAAAIASSPSNRRRHLGRISSRATVNAAQRTTAKSLCSAVGRPLPAQTSASASRRSSGVRAAPATSLPLRLLDRPSGAGEGAASKGSTASMTVAHAGCAAEAGPESAAPAPSPSLPASSTSSSYVSVSSGSLSPRLWRRCAPAAAAPLRAGGGGMGACAAPPSDSGAPPAAWPGAEAAGAMPTIAASSAPSSWSGLLLLREWPRFPEWAATSASPWMRPSSSSSESCLSPDGLWPPE
mmetsp:Transcript_15459/g.58554  ORF Transcript_15459/g.58554 Transcript_15459/m.58554 type:complete len:437 (-) Transcript_15459:1367-2677(-)